MNAGFPRVLFALFALSAIAADRHVGVLRPGEFFWEPELAPSGPVVIVISLPDQTLSAYRNGIRVGYSSISSGTPGRRTPAGVFTILQKKITHFSSKYNRAPMPYMQRLTWEGVALHGGELPGYPASHGCIRLPHKFAEKLYTITSRGTTVAVVDERRPLPWLAAQPGILLMPSSAEESTGATAGATPADHEWQPERSPEGPISIIASGADRVVYVYRNGVPIGRAPLEILQPHNSLGSHVFTMLEGLGEVLSVFVPNRPAHQWMAVRTEGNATLQDLAPRARISPEFAAKLYDLVVPGTTIVITDAPALRGSPESRAVFLFESK